MKLNLKKDYEKLSRFIKKRMKDYPKYINEGPGEDEDPITQITFGFDFIHSGWAALVFDTRKESEIDGEWQNYIELNELNMMNWYKAFDSLENGKKIIVEGVDGATTTLTEPNEEVFSDILGKFLSQVLEDHRGAVCSKLPVSDDYSFCVEHQEGIFGWSDVGKDDSASDLINEFESLSQSAQIEKFDKLVRQSIISDTQHELFESIVSKLESSAVKEVLKIFLSIADNKEFRGDVPSKTISCLPYQNVAFEILDFIEENLVPDLETEEILNEILRKVVKTNSKRKRWGIIPCNVANILYESFNGYPEPLQNDDTNKLENYKQYFDK